MLDFILPSSAVPGISQAVAVRSGQPVFLSGHVPVRDDGTLETGSLEAQLESAFSNLTRTLAAANVDRGNIVRITIYVRDYDPRELGVIRAVRDRFVSTGAPPASALIGVSSLFHPAVRVEIDAIAVRSP